MSEEKKIIVIDWDEDKSDNDLFFVECFGIKLQTMLFGPIWNRTIFIYSEHKNVFNENTKPVHTEKSPMGIYLE